VWVRELSLSRDLLTNDIALFSIVVIISGTETFAFDGKYKSQKNINIKMFLQNLKCCRVLLLLKIFSEVNVIFNVILMFNVLTQV
jgi:hypothetical protein